MFTTREGIRQPLVERGISDLNINPAHADMPAHGLWVPAIIIRIFSSSCVAGFAPPADVLCSCSFRRPAIDRIRFKTGGKALRPDVHFEAFAGVPVAQVDFYRFSFFQFQVQ